MKINFLLPITLMPAGGPKVVYEYANKMTADGIAVTIVYPIIFRYDKAASASFFTRLQARKKIITKKLKNKYAAKTWFDLNPGVKEILVPFLSEKFIPDADITFATAWETAEWLNTYTASKGKKMYLIQHYEDWSGTKAEVDKTWKMPLQKIVIARWLRDHAVLLGEESVIVNNGLDFTKYFVDNSIEKRNPYQLIMLYHEYDWKGSADGLKAIALAKEKNSGIELILFGTPDRPVNIPSWVEYHKNPTDLKDLYNRAAIFISPSWGEGWALPPAEAMQCGCAAIITDIGGHRDYGNNNSDLLLVPPKDHATMADTINKLIENNERRIEIAKSGNNNIQQFTWEKAYTKLKECF
jgi:glycosyltransferase involved in cell wall biosynthesis